MVLCAGWVWGGCEVGALHVCGRSGVRYMKWALGEKGGGGERYLCGYAPVGGCASDFIRHGREHTCHISRVNVLTLDIRCGTVHRRVGRDVSVVQRD